MFSVEVRNDMNIMLLIETREMYDYANE